MNRILFAALTLGLMLGLAGVAGAADEKKKKKKNDGADVTAAFTKLDANGDKKVSKEEFDAFKGLQTPKPGKEGKEPKGLAEVRGKWFTKLDANNDGSVTAQEFAKLKEVVAANPPEKKKKKAK
jgi:Ca2+-binding EF-hand superfamily protein